MGKSVSTKKIVLSIIGCILLVSAAIMLVLNEISTSATDALKATQELTESNSVGLDGKGVWIKGKINSVNRATDPDYIFVSDCVVLRRYVEIYKKYTTTHYDSDGNYQYETTDYQWEYDSHTYITANDLMLDAYRIAKNTDVEFVDMPLLDLSGHVLNGTVTNNLIYPNKNSGSAQFPSEYDIRVSYRFLKNGAEGVFIGKLNGNQLIRFNYGFPNVSLYNFYYDTSMENIWQSMATTRLVVLWTLRITGSLLAGTGLLLIGLAFKKSRPRQITWTRF